MVFQKRVYRNDDFEPMAVQFDAFGFHLFQFQRLLQHHSNKGKMVF